MEIGLICQNYPPASEEGGISHYSRHLAQSLAARGHQVWAITSTGFSLLSEPTDRENGVQVARVKGPWNHRTVSEMREVADEAGLDALILQYSPASFKRSFRVAWAFARFPCQKITTFHTLWGTHLDRMVAILLLAGSTKVIATNSEIMTLLERYLPVFLKKTYWIPIGSNILPREAPEPGLIPSDPVVSFFGMIYPGKGLDLILDVLTELKRRDQNVHFKFIGGTEWDKEGLERAFRKQITERKLDDVAEHLGMIPADEVSIWFRKSRFVFLPYEGEVSDRRGSLMAALVHGKAVLTSPPAVDMPFLQNGINLLWPGVPSVDGYARLFERLLVDNTLVLSLQEGALTLSKHFRWENIAREHDLVLSLGFTGR